MRGGGADRRKPGQQDEWSGDEMEGRQQGVRRVMGDSVRGEN